MADLVELAGLTRALNNSLKNLREYQRQEMLKEIQDPATPAKRRDVLTELLLLDGLNIDREEGIIDVSKNV